VKKDELFNHFNTVILSGVEGPGVACTTIKAARNSHRNAGNIVNMIQPEALSFETGDELVIPFNSVILSAVAASRSESATESKDLLSLVRRSKPQGIRTAMQETS